MSALHYDGFPKKNYTFQEFIEMLKALDILLGEFDYRCEFDIYAIGGFSMMYNASIFNMKSRDLSCDIDTMSFIEPEVQECITKAGKGDGHWINNEWYKNARSFEDELFDENEFIKDEEYDFNNINLYVANIKTLLSFKIRAFQCRIDDFLDPRDSDTDDVAYIIDYLHLSREEFVKLMNDYDLYEKYPQAMDYAIETYYD